MSESYQDWTTEFRKQKPVIDETISKMKTYGVKSMTQMSHGFWFAQGVALAVVILMILF